MLLIKILFLLLLFIIDVTTRLIDSQIANWN